MTEDVKYLIERARKQARLYRAKVMNCVDRTGKSDGEWSETASLLTNLCDALDGTPPQVRCAIEFAIFFGADPEVAETLKNDPEFVEKYGRYAVTSKGMKMAEEETFERPKIEPYKKAYRLAEDWHTSCKGVLAEKITIPKGTLTDGASIPRFLWRVCGTPMDVPRIYAAIVHDYLYELGGTDDDRQKADQLYRDFNIALGMKKWKAYVEYGALRMFGGGHWDEKDK